jgi:2-iminobutanoate/2-iminopropanoate deaminase
MAKTELRTDEAPNPVAAFSQGVRKGNVIQVAGQVGMDPTGQLAGTTVGEQARQTLTNVAAVLAAGGASFDDVVMVRVYLTDTSHFDELNKVYGDFMSTNVSEPYPARTTVYVGLPKGLLVEIDALAVVD